MKAFVLALAVMAASLGPSTAADEIAQRLAQVGNAFQDRWSGEPSSTGAAPAPAPAATPPAPPRPAAPARAPIYDDEPKFDAPAIDKGDRAEVTRSIKTSRAKAAPRAKSKAAPRGRKRSTAAQSVTQPAARTTAKPAARAKIAPRPKATAKPRPSAPARQTRRVIPVSPSANPFAFALPLAFTADQRRTVYNLVAQQEPMLAFASGAPEAASAPQTSASGYALPFLSSAQPTYVGSRLQRNTELTAFPDQVVTAVPPLASYGYIVVGERILIVDPASAVVVADLAREPQSL